MLYITKRIVCFLKFDGREEDGKKVGEGVFFLSKN